MPAKIITRARFNECPVAASEMRGVGQAFIQSQDARLSQGLNLRDQPAPKLSPEYAERKAAMGKRPIRDWFLSGLTRGSIKVLQAEPNRVVIGSGNPVGDLRIRVNQKRERQFGVSPTDLTAIKDAVMKVLSMGKAGTE